MTETAPQWMDEVIAEREQMASALDIRNVRFFSRYVPRKNDPANMDRVDWVEWTKVGENYEAVTRAAVHRMRPVPGKRLGAIEWSVIGKLYEAWRSGLEAPVDGTPLDAWNGLDKDDIEYLRRQHRIETLEQFVAMPDGQLARCQLHGARERVKRAKMFLDAQAGTAEVQRAMAERDALLERQQAEIEAMKEMLSALTADSPETAEEPVRRGPGRPRKTEAEAA